jgi:preprotein translocase subunit YajC
MARVNNNGGGLAGLILPLVLVGLLILLFMTQRRRSRAAADVQRQLRPGMNVMTTAGLYAEVQAVDDEAVSLEIAPGVVCRFARAAVARVLDPVGDPPMDSGNGRSDGGRNDGGPDDGPPPAAPAT